MNYQPGAFGGGESRYLDDAPLFSVKMKKPPVNVVAFLGAGLWLRHLQRRAQREGE